MVAFAKQISEFENVRLAAFEVFASTSQEPQRCHIADVSQNCSYSKGTRKLMGCLLRNSMPWLVNQDCFVC